MPVLTRNHRHIQSLRVAPGKQESFYVEGVKGLVLVVSKGGMRSWYVRYQVTAADGSRVFRRYRIGDAATIGLADATEITRKLMAQVELEKRDPFGEENGKVRSIKTGKIVTFDDLFEAWFRRHAEPHLVKPGAERLKYNNHLKGPFGSRAIKDIKRVEVGELRDLLVTSSGPVSSNNIVTLFNRIMNWAVDEGLIEFNPAHRLRKVGDERPRERVLSESEIRTFWQALDRMDQSDGAHMKRGETGRMLSPATRSALRLVLLTGQRRQEVSAIAKSELELESKTPVWTLPGKRAKNRLLHRVPLTPMAVAEIRKALAAANPKSSYLFPTAVEGRDAPMLPFALTTAMARLSAEIGIPRAGPHDLRRTVGTELARLGLPTHVRALVLNHSPESRGVTDVVYNRYAYDNEKRDALEKWEARLRELLGLCQS